MLLLYASPLSISLSVTFLQLFLYIYAVHSPRFIRSLHFIPSPCFIPSLQSIVRSGQSSFYTDSFERQFSHSVGKN